MVDRYLHREDAPFGEDIWRILDEAVVGAAKSQLSARQLLHTDGPFGFGLKSLPGPDGEVADGMSASLSKPLVLLREQFILGARDIAAHEQGGLILEAGAAARAAIACARREDDILFNGVKALGLEGLLTAKGVQSVPLKAWVEIGAAVDNVIHAVTKLDDSGFHGPYVLALAPALYNLLFRRYPQGNATELEHMQVLVSGGVVKAPGVKSGGALLASGRQYASIVVGQDLVTGFVGPAENGYEFTVGETIALRLAVPQAVCVLKQ
jgi:uncharacterized linocin/CFP29 family protein